MSLLFFYPQKSYCHPALRDLLASRARSAPSTVRSAILAAKLQIFVDFGIGFGGKMLQEVANYPFFCWISQKVVEIFGSFENYSYLCIYLGR